MKKLKRKLLQILLYTTVWRNVDKYVDLRHYDSNNIKLGREKKKWEVLFLQYLYGYY